MSDDVKEPVVPGAAHGGAQSVTDSKTSSSLRLDRAEAFADGGDVRFYRPIEGYEGMHRYDPREEWTPQEEKKLVRKVCQTPPGESRRRGDDTVMECLGQRWTTDGGASSTIAFARGPVSCSSHCSWTAEISSRPCRITC